MAEADPLIVTVHRDDDRTLLRVEGEVDLLTVAELERPLTAALHAREPVTLDLSEVTFIDSTGLRLLLESRNRAAGADGHGLVLRLGANPQVHRLLGLAGVLHLFDLEP